MNMNFDYSSHNNRIYSPKYNTTRYSNENNFSTSFYNNNISKYEPYEPITIPYNRPSSPLMVKQEHSPYFLEFENDELAHSLYEEKRVNRELLSILDSNKYELQVLGRRYDSKVDEINSLAVKYDQSEQIRKDQANLISSLQKELDTLREKVKQMEISNEEENENNKTQTSGKTATKSLKNGEKSTSKNPFTKNLTSSMNKSTSKLKTSTVSNVKPVKKGVTSSGKK